MWVTFALLLALATGAPAPAPPSAPPGPVVLSRAQADSVHRLLEKDRDDTREWLKSAPTSYLATTQRIEYLWRSRLRVGRADTCDVRLDDPAVRPFHLGVTVVGDSFRVVAHGDSATFKFKGTELRAATLGPSNIGVGRYTLRRSEERRVGKECRL